MSVYRDAEHISVYHQPRRRHIINGKNDRLLNTRKKYLVEQYNYFNWTLLADATPRACFTCINAVSVLSPPLCNPLD
jgi:hypothetical protein